MPHTLAGLPPTKAHVGAPLLAVRGGLSSRCARAEVPAPVAHGAGGSSSAMRTGKLSSGGTPFSSDDRDSASATNCTSSSAELRPPTAAATSCPSGGAELRLGVVEALYDVAAHLHDEAICMIPADDEPAGMRGRRASIAKVQPPRLGEVRQSCTADSCRVEVQQPTAQMQGCPSCSVTQLPQQPMAQAQGCPSSSSAQLPQQPLAPVQSCPSSSSSQLPQQPTTQEQGCPGSNSTQLPQQSTALVQGCPRNGNGTGLPQWATTRELFSAMAKGSAAHGASASDAPRAAQCVPSSAMAGSAAHGPSASVALQAVQHVSPSATTGPAAHYTSASVVPRAVQLVSPSATAECACVACERADFEVESECVATAHGSCKLEELVECASAEQLRQGSRCAMIRVHTVCHNAGAGGQLLRAGGVCTSGAG
ncbi:hypothetical protein CYMTET_6291 [Cymbomonas tetramitiformis]|uniref:Uncharacterized protein n=1 Tax=Cymbomonas tetramitiformis TaxID=36881 RepID=A0AAE0LI76_9CHLO|nr:hypothetical protein CYMTET_6291 [Cymbomonas tetramitiformis]